MTVEVTTDPERIAVLVEARLAADPVRATVLGTISLQLHEKRCWCATTPTGALAVRSDPAYPACVDGTWTLAELDDLTAELVRLPQLRGVTGPVAMVTELVTRLQRQPDRRVALRLFRLDELRSADDVAGHPRRAADDDRHLVKSWFTAFAAEADGTLDHVDQAVAAALAAGGCWLWHTSDDTTVSLAVRRPVVAGSSRIGPVYTPPEHRGRGYGSAVTAAATADVLHDGAIPVLFTDLANPTSNDIYQRLGYHPVEDRLQVEFR